MRFKELILVSLCITMLSASCDTKEEPITEEPPVENPSDAPEPEDPENPEQPEVTLQPKKVSLWISTSVNFSRLKSKSSIKHFMDLIEGAGFNEIIVEVKTMQGKALYFSDILDYQTTANGFTVERDWDYLQYFIDQAHSRGMTVLAASTVFPDYREEWEQYCCIEHLPGGLKSIKDSQDSGIFPFLNPVYPEVRELVMSVCEEIVTKYDVDGLVLDYCRYQNANSDFSEASKKAFEEYAGVTCTNFPYDIYYYPEGETDKGEYKPSTHYNKWMEWRSHVIQGYVKEISERVKAIKPDISLQYWAAAWWPLPGTGQNWASQKYTNYPYWWATDQYYKTGFAEYLDVFQNGAYYSKVTPMWESGTIAHALYQGDAIIKDACQHYSSFSVADSSFDVKEAAKYSYLNADGVMVFELCYMVKYDWWDEVKAGIQEAETELGIVRE